MILKVVLLIALIRLLIASGKPFLCSGIYAGAAWLIGLGSLQASFLMVTLLAAIRFLLASVYFWLLDRFEENSGLFWLIAALGIFIGLV